MTECAGIVEINFNRHQIILPTIRKEQQATIITTIFKERTFIKENN